MAQRNERKIAGMNLCFRSFTVGFAIFIRARTRAISTWQYFVIVSAGDNFARIAYIKLLVISLEQDSYIRRQVYSDVKDKETFKTSVGVLEGQVLGLGVGL